MARNTVKDPKGSKALMNSAETLEETSEAAYREPHVDLFSVREAFLQEQNLCCLCGHDLTFQHVVDFIQLTVIESASCDSCKIQLRKRLFTLN